LTYDQDTRIIPYILPKKIKHKIDKLFNISNLNSGTFDMILSENNTYYFLEINPFGQFDLIEKTTNAGIYKKISRWLKAK